MSEATVPSITSKETSSISSEENVNPRFPKFRCMDDVIDNFFQQIIQYVIEDMIILEPKEGSEVTEPDDSDDVTKDYKELKPEDLVNAEVSSGSGSRITLTKRSGSGSAKRLKKSFPSSLDVIKEEPSQQFYSVTDIKEPESSQKTLSKSSTGTSESSLDEEHQARITFINGNTYEGTIFRRIMNGQGRYTWTDGTIYEGQFKNGFPTGKGKMTLPDLSHYEGEFNQGLFHGNGFLNIVSTPTFYSGEWKDGKKHGQGWLLYEPGDWYEGGWAKDLKEGFGLRHYKNGAKYRGMWQKGKYHGKGVMIWENYDYYKGEWYKGTMHGEGEYIWKAFFNDAFAFPVQNIYRGSWENGNRSGFGTMHFGDDTGLRLIGNWHKNVKHGDGHLVCGNGKIIDRGDLFLYDKNIEPEVPQWMIRGSRSARRLLDFPIFSGPEYVDVGYYLDEVLAKISEVNPDKLKLLKTFEEKCIRYVIVRHLPQLKELYQDYASIAAKTKLCYEPIMIRLFLWQFYKDKEIHKYELSLADTDIILFKNPRSCMDSKHNPFEPIYFWQFLLSLIGVALSGTSLETTEDSEVSTTQGVCAKIIQKFFVDVIFAKSSGHKSSLLLNYMDLAPIKSVYSLYQKIGEPHSARTFLRESCLKIGEPLLTSYMSFSRQFKLRFGTNLVPINQCVIYESERETTGRLSNLYNFRLLGPRSIVRCLAKSCPLIMDENRVVNIDYPLIFLEFYETLLTCIFMALEQELKKEEKMLLHRASVSPQESIYSKSRSDPRRKSEKDGKKVRKKKKKSL